MKKPVFIIEHLEKGISKWSLIEYKNISSFIGRNNLWFTNIKRKNKSLEKHGRIKTIALTDSGNKIAEFIEKIEENLR